MAAGSFPGAKRLQHGVNHTPPSSAEDKERLELYFFSPSVSSGSFIGLSLILSLDLCIKHIRNLKSTPRDEKLAKDCLPFG
jgi:hypothetical protein